LLWSVRIEVMFSCIVSVFVCFGQFVLRLCLVYCVCLRLLWSVLIEVMLSCIVSVFVCCGQFVLRLCLVVLCLSSFVLVSSY
jgi:hypothetical protein